MRLAPYLIARCVDHTKTWVKAHANWTKVKQSLNKIKFCWWWFWSVAVLWPLIVLEFNNFSVLYIPIKIFPLIIIQHPKYVKVIIEIPVDRDYHDDELTGRSFDSRTASVIAWVLNFITYNKQHHIAMKWFLLIIIREKKSSLLLQFSTKPSLWSWWLKPHAHTHHVEAQC